VVAILDWKYCLPQKSIVVKIVECKLEDCVLTRLREAMDILEID
jgi:hypothetical protein